jgi:hypothetical protein
MVDGMEWSTQRDAMAMLATHSKLPPANFQLLSSNLVDQPAKNHKNQQITVKFTGSIALQAFEIAKNIH